MMLLPAGCFVRGTVVLWLDSMTSKVLSNLDDSVKT